MKLLRGPESDRKDPVELGLSLYGFHSTSTKRSPFRLNLSRVTLLRERNDEGVTFNPRVRLGVLLMHGLDYFVHEVFDRSVLTVEVSAHLALQERFFEKPVRGPNQKLQQDATWHHMAATKQWS